MSVTSWGKCTIYVQEVGSKKNEWTKLPTPKDGTTTVTPTKGDTMTQVEEGGGIVDRKTKKSTYEAAYQLFIKKNQSQPFKTIDGIIEGNYRLAIQPEDAELPGVYMGNTTIGAEEGYTTEEGASITYTHAALIPEGDVVAKTVNAKGEDVYCAYRWRVITAAKETGGKYSLTFKKPQDGENPPAEITETYAET